MWEEFEHPNSTNHQRLSYQSMTISIVYFNFFHTFRSYCMRIKENLKLSISFLFWTWHKKVVFLKTRRMVCWQLNNLIILFFGVMNTTFHPTDCLSAFVVSIWEFIDLSVLVVYYLVVLVKLFVIPFCHLKLFFVICGFLRFSRWQFS